MAPAVSKASTFPQEPAPQQASGEAGAAAPVDEGPAPVAVDLELIIVGAGPCALALVDRLACRRPDCSLDYAFGFDSPNEKLAKTLDRLIREEHRDAVGKVRDAASKAAGMHTCGGSESSDRLEGRVCIFESTGRFMGRWEDLFSTLDIQHLRSPHTAHPSCTHTQALLAHAKSTGQTDEFVDLGHLRYNGTHRAPSTALFSDFCRRLWERHGLEKLLRKGTVTRIVPVWQDDKKREAVSHFLVHVERPAPEPALDGAPLMVTEVLSCRAVVVATGTAQCPRIPDWMSEARMTAASGQLSSHLAQNHHHQQQQQQQQQAPAHSLRHAWELPADLLARGGGTDRDGQGAGQDLRPGERVMIVGGGLTSAQLALVAVAKGSSHVSLVIRRPPVVQPFDSDIRWTDRETRPAALTRFFSLPAAERLAVIRGVRRYGSIPRTAFEQLERAGVRIVADTEIKQLHWDAGAQQWLVVLEGSGNGGSTRQRTLEHYHRVWAATGSDVSVEQDPLLAQLLDDCPIPTLGGFPCLTPWLSWSDQCKVFVLGAYAALTLGADAFNLMGARMGSSRVGYVLDAMLDESADDKEVRARQDRVASMRFRFDSKSQHVKGAALRV